jgi:hypothetical protein
LLLLFRPLNFAKPLAFRDQSTAQIRMMLMSRCLSYAMFMMLQLLLLSPRPSTPFQSPALLAHNTNTNIHSRMTVTTTTTATAVFGQQQRGEEHGKESNDQTPIYQFLCTPRDNTKNRRPGGSNFFYNDEVASHLHGYMFLVGTFAARDETFVLTFCLLASLAAGATLAGYLPANPRVPAMVAIGTLASTYLLRVGIGYEFQLFDYDHQVPADDFGRAMEHSGFALEAAICALNVAWGVWGSWQTKELSKDGATTGF